MRDDLQIEVERLIGIAHLHARNALARPAAQRDTHLAVCRDFWKHYAAAYTASDAQRDSFADALDRATRDLMAEMQQTAQVAYLPSGLHPAEALARLQSGRPIAHTLEELRPIFRQIIGQ